jgi:hypothetical protein
MRNGDHIQGRRLVCGRAAGGGRGAGGGCGPPPPAWQLEGLTPRARRTLAAQLVAAGASRAVKGLSGAILNYYTTADHKIRPEILPTLA